MSEIYLSIVVPCHNGEGGMEELLRRLTAVCVAQGETYEIVLVDDGSRDRTWELMSQAAHADPHVVAAKLSRNHGHQLALSAGLQICRGDRVLIIDDDLQDPPELLPEMMAIMDRGVEVVYGQRSERQGENVIKRGMAAFFYRMINRLAERPIPLDTGDFRLLSRRALDTLNAMPERHRFIRGMISWIGYQQVPLVYERAPRFAGASHYSFRKRLRLALDGVTALSIKPLQIASWIGLWTGVLAIGLLVYSLVGWLRGNIIAGWTSLMATVAVMSSVQLFVLGIIGEYLGRLYEQSKGRPLYVIDRIVRQSDGADAQRAGQTTVSHGSGV